jgi:hypothetical protein
LTSVLHFISQTQLILALPVTSPQRLFIARIDEGARFAPPLDERA